MRLPASTIFCLIGLLAEKVSTLLLGLLVHWSVACRRLSGMPIENVSCVDRSAVSTRRTSFARSCTVERTRTVNLLQ